MTTTLSVTCGWVQLGSETDYKALDYVATLTFPTTERTELNKHCLQLQVAQTGRVGQFDFMVSGIYHSTLSALRVRVPFLRGRLD